MGPTKPSVRMGLAVALASVLATASLLALAAPLAKPQAAADQYRTSHRHEHDPILALPSEPQQQQQQQQQHPGYQIVYEVQPAGAAEEAGAAEYGQQPAAQQQQQQQQQEIVVYKQVMQEAPGEQYQLAQTSGGEQAHQTAAAPCAQRHSAEAAGADSAPTAGQEASIVAGGEQQGAGPSGEYPGEIIYLGQNGEVVARSQPPQQAQAEQQQPQQQQQQQQPQQQQQQHSLIEMAGSLAQTQGVAATILTEIPVRDMPEEVLEKLKRDYGVKVVATRERPGANLVINCEDYSNLDSAICARGAAAQQQHRLRPAAHIESAEQPATELSPAHVVMNNDHTGYLLAQPPYEPHYISALGEHHDEHHDEHHAQPHEQHEQHELQQQHQNQAEQHHSGHGPQTTTTTHAVYLSHEPASLVEPEAAHGDSNEAAGARYAHGHEQQHAQPESHHQHHHNYHHSHHERQHELVTYTTNSHAHPRPHQEQQNYGAQAQAQASQVNGGEPATESYQHNSSTTASVYGANENQPQTSTVASYDRQQQQQQQHYTGEPNNGASTTTASQPDQQETPTLAEQQGAEQASGFEHSGAHGAEEPPSQFQSQSQEYSQTTEHHH